MLTPPPIVGSDNWAIDAYLFIERVAKPMLDKIADGKIDMHVQNINGVQVISIRADILPTEKPAFNLAIDISESDAGCSINFRSVKGRRGADPASSDKNEEA